MEVERYTAIEMLALVEFIDHFRYYLPRCKFLIRTDHHALKWLMSFKQPEGQVARWLERLQEYDFDIEHRPGKSHVNADALSRKPRRKHGSCPSCVDTEFVAAATLLEDKRAEETPESRESDFSWSADEIVEAQRNDPDLHPVITQIKEGRSPSRAKELQSHSPLTRAIYAQYPLLELEDNVLKLRPKDEQKHCKPRVILPACLVQPALK